MVAIAAAAVLVPAPAFADAVSVPAPDRSVSTFSFFSARTASTPKAYWNPCSTIRFGIDTSQATAAAAGVGGAANAIPLWQSLSSVLLWPLAALGLATAAFGKVTP